MFFGQRGAGDATLGRLSAGTMGSWFDTPEGYASLINDPWLPSIGNVNGGTVYGSSGPGIDWQSIINQGFGVGSQIISAWGRNPTQQVGTPGVIGIGQGYSPAAVLQAQGQTQQAIAQQQALLAQQQRLGAGGTNSLDGIAGSIMNTISANPLIFAGGALALFLLFREPPRRR